MPVLFKLIYAAKTYDVLNAECNQQSAGVNRVVVQDGKPVMTWLDEKQGELIAFRPRIEQAISDRQEAVRVSVVATAKLNGGITMAIGFGVALGLENFNMKPTKDLQSTATSLSLKLAEISDPPAKEVKHFLDVSAKAHLRAKAHVDAASEKAKRLDAEWVELSTSLRRLIRMAKALQTSAGLPVARRKKKPASTTPRAAVAENPVIEPTTPTQPTSNETTAPGEAGAPESIVAA